MTSTLTLYYKSLINKDKNFILDNPSNGKSTIETYLSTLEKQVISGFQYVKQGLSVAIKINKTQDELMMGYESKDLNYVKIQNDSQTPCYYFIINKMWKSENTIELVLNMDTLNSFEFNRDYELNKKTLVKREHRDRFELVEKEVTFDWEFYNSVSDYPNAKFYTNLNLANSIDTEVLSYEIIFEDNPGQTEIQSCEPYEQDGVKGLRCTSSTISYNRIVLRVVYRFRTYKRLIDMKSEEISTPVYKTEETQLIEEEGRGEVNWSLYYKNSSNQEDAPVDCLLIPDTAVQVQYINQDGIIDTNNASSNFMIFCHKYSGDLSFSIDGKTYAVNASKGADWGFRLIAVTKNGADIDVYSAKLEKDQIIFGIIVYNGKWEKIFTGSSIKLLTPISTIKYFSTATLPSSSQWFNNTYYLPVNAQSSLVFGTQIEGVALSKSDIDRTDPTNIKIIDLPYSPNSFQVNDNGVYVLASLWQYDSGLKNLKLVDYASPFRNDIKSNCISIAKDFLIPIDMNNILNKNRFLKDSKLYHSDYYRPKFVYDSFTKVFALEHINYDPEVDFEYSFNFTFVMSRNIVSKFLFMFNYTWRESTEDYPNIVAVARNNEEVLYNSAYINYLKMGYNYDVKAKERQETASALGIGLNLAGIVGSIVLAVATENPLPIAGAVAGGIGLVGQTINYAKTTAQNEENIQRKVQESQLQSISVMNADDIDLLVAYSSNKAKLCYYETSERMQKILDDLFYYGGYVTNEQKIPNVKTRYWFNYVQASLVLEETNNLTEEIESDIKEKFENGVTFLHLRNGTFDLKQEKENIETSIVGG